jgi:hypothetical protein
LWLRVVCSLVGVVKMRGYSATPELSIDSFIILDRLYMTLDDKIDEWSARQKEYQGFCFGGCCWGANLVGQAELMKDRLLVAYDLSAAFSYMHKHK